MKYIRTKGGRIVEECNLEPGLKQSIITITDKKNNKDLGQIICDDSSEFFEIVAIGEYCKFHKINPKDIKWEREILLNDILKQSDTIEELCDCFVKIKRKGNCKPYILKFDFKDLPTLKEQAIKYKDSPVYGAIHIEDKGLIYVAKMNDKGELELL